MYGTPNSDTTGGSCVSNTKTPRTVFGAESSGGYRSSAVAPGSGLFTTSAYGSACLEFSAFLLCVLAFNSEQACPVSALSLSVVLTAQELKDFLPGDLLRRHSSPRRLQPPSGLFGKSYQTLVRLQKFHLPFSQPEVAGAEGHFAEGHFTLLKLTLDGV